MSKLKPQVIAIYKHEQRKLAYVSLINEDRRDAEGKIEQQYSRARSVHKAILTGNSREMSSGFMFALINTDFAGWTCEVVDRVFDGSEAAGARDVYIAEVISQGYSFIGAHRTFHKGVYGNKVTEYRWNAKFDVTKMKKAQIDEKIDFMFQAAETLPDADLRKQVYFAIVCPDQYGPKFKNLGSYVIDSMANIFLFVRHLSGCDLQRGENV